MRACAECSRLERNSRLQSLLYRPPVVTAEQRLLQARHVEPFTPVLGYSAAFDWDRVGAEQEYQEALRLSPNHATSHQWYAELLAFLGRKDEAFAECRKALELDPLSPVIQWQWVPGCTISVSRTRR
jgi:Flp pilus assembly protein TadD